MTEKEKAKAYDEAIERAKKLYDNGITEEIFPELKEDDTERIRKNCIHFLELQKQHHAATFEIEECIDWLETQGESGTFDIPQTPIKDAVEVTSRMQFISDDMKPIAEFIMGYANWNLHKDEWNQPTLTVPLFRVLDALIQRGKPYGECSQNIEKQDEQKPTIEMKSAEESLGISSEEYNKIVDKLIYDEQKHTDKVEPKFKVGDKITNTFRKYVGASGSQAIISEITDNKYIFTDGSYIFISNQDSWELAPDKNPKFDTETLKTYNDINIGDTVYIWGSGDSSVDETTITEKYDDRGHWNLKFSNGCVGRALKNGTSSTMGMYACLVYSDKEAVRESINERIKILSNIKI